MIYLPLFYGRPAEFCRITPFRVQWWLTLGCKCTPTLIHRGGQKTLHTTGLEGSVAPLKCDFTRPSQRIICFAFLPVSFIEAC